MVERKTDTVSQTIENLPPTVKKALAYVIDKLGPWGTALLLVWFLGNERLSQEETSQGLQRDMLQELRDARLAMQTTTSELEQWRKAADAFR